MIFKCSLLNQGACDGTGWHRQTYHPTGIPWAEPHCPKYATRREALAAAREATEDARALAYEDEAYQDYRG